MSAGSVGHGGAHAPGAVTAPLRASVTALGCKVNFAEMADLAGALAAAGVEVVRDDEPADVRVLNSCTVTLQADATTRQRLARLRRDDPDAHLVLTGCSVDGNPDRYPPTGAEDGWRPVPGVDAVFANARKGDIAAHVLALAEARGAAPAPAGPATALRARSFLKVQDGCDHRCTYCAVWRARGRSTSTPLEQCVQRFDVLVAGGVREVVLCGVDLGSWGREHGLRLHHLVAALLERAGPARLRLSSVNANDIDDALVELAAHPRLCSHWHVPLQSGADPVLRAMHRGYRRARYLRVVDGLRAADPDVEMTTDVMVAFPGETEDDHRATLDLVGRVGFLHCHVFRHSPRPGTPAAAMDGAVDDATARRRSREVRRAAAKTGAVRRARMVGRAVEVVWDRVDGDGARGLSGGWHSVSVAPAPGARAGDLARVSVDAVDGDGLRATLLHP